jgi:outer membrane receptor protein involved in Fe transport
MGGKQMRVRRSRSSEVFSTSISIITAIVVSLLIGSSCLAQSTAVVQGLVTDPSGAVVPNAKIIVRNIATGFERSTETDSSGNYQVAALPVGVYRVEVQASGFGNQAVTDLRLEVSQTVVQNFPLKVGNVAQEVNVSAEAPVVESTTTTVGQVISQKTVQEIPLNGRHFVDLGLLIPGSVTPPQNGFLTAPLRGQGSFAFNTAGNREDTVNFMINGVNLNDMVQNQITFQPSINTVQEFKVDNSTYSAEYGRNSGAIVNIATRSGTNEFHGEAFEFFRNNVLDARNFFDVTKPPFRRNQFGTALGGPIIKDKAFFFFSYEGLRQRQGLTINSGVPSDAQRAAVTSATVKKLLTLIPVSNFNNNGVAQFRGSATAPVNIDQWTGDVSYNLGNNDRIHGYYAGQRDRRGEPILQGNTLPSFGDTRQSRRQIFTLNESHTFGPSLVNEARFGFNRIHITFSPNADLNPADFGINNGINEALALPQINITGSTFNFGGPSGFPQGRGDTTFVFADTVSYLKGAHSLKIGGEYRQFLNNNFSRDGGTYNFASMAAFLADQANQFTVTLGSPSSSIAQGALGFFVQDNWKLRPNLTLELGLRYDWNMTPSERYDRFVVFDPQTAQLQRVGNGIDQVYKSNNKNFQPRVGFAWDPFKDGKTSVRAAYAILTDQPITNLVTPVSTNPPLANPLALPGGKTTTFETALIDTGFAGINPNSVDQDFDNAYVQSWNLNIQRELPMSIGLTIGYFGSKGTHLRITRNINQPINGVRPFRAVAANSPILPGLSLATSNILERDSGANSSYNALWLTVDKRLAKGLQFNASYTYSKSIDYNSQNGQGVTVQDSYNIQGDRGLSDYDARNRFVIHLLYELPFTGNRLKEGWQLSFITQAQSGNPLNIVINSNALTGTANAVRPDLIGSIDDIGRVEQWFSNSVCDPSIAGSCTASSVFAIPRVGTTTAFKFGTLGRNVVIGPDFNNTDFSVIKRTRITERLNLQFRAEFFDIFNQTNFGQPGRIAGVGSTAFGVVTNTRFGTGDSGSSRQIQFAMKLTF